MIAEEVSAAGLVSLAGKIGCGIFADRVGAKPALVAFRPPRAVGAALQAA